MNDSVLMSALVTQLIQITCLIVFVWGLVKLFARQRPFLAHTLWMLVLIKCV